MYDRGEQTQARLARLSRGLLVAALALVMTVFALDRYARAVHVPSENSTAVVIYTTVWCPYCNALRISLTNARVPFVEHDMEKTLQGQLGFWALGARGVPVSVIGPRVIYGYQVAEIERALGALGYSLSGPAVDAKH